MKKRSAVKIFFSVVYALLMREITTRFGSQKLGYLWAIIEPMAMIVIFSIIHSKMNTKVPYDMSVFLATSFVSYNLFKDIVLRNLETFNANKGLFVYKQVKPFDAIISRMILEFVLQCFVVIVLLIIGYYVGVDMKVKDLLSVLLAVLWFVLFGFGLAVLFAFLSYFFENFAKIARLIFLPMFFISGLFFSAESLPPQIRDILLLNPVFQFEEMIHGFYFYALDDRYVNYIYLIFWTLIPMFLGLWLYKKTERKIIMS